MDAEVAREAKAERGRNCPLIMMIKIMKNVETNSELMRQAEHIDPRGLANLRYALGSGNEHDKRFVYLVVT